MPALTFWVMPEIARVAGLTPVFADVDPRDVQRHDRRVARARDHAEDGRGRAHASLGPAVRHGRRSSRSPGAHKLAVDRGLRARARRDVSRPARSARSATPRSSAFRRSSRSTRTAAAWRSRATPGLADRIAALVAAEPPPTDETGQEAAVAGPRAADLDPAARVHLDAVSDPLDVARCSTRIRTSTCGRRSARSIRCRADYRERYSNVQAAIGLAGAEAARSVDARRRRRTRRASTRRACRHVPGVRLPLVPADRTHAFYQYCAYVPGPRRDRARAV